MSKAGRVLIVEDNDAERRALAEVLKHHGFEVNAVENADKAIGYAEEPIDVVVSDLMMGEVSGLDLLDLWRKRRENSHFILLTGQSSISTAVDAIKRGAFDYITKPLNPDELIILLKRAVADLRTRDEVEHLRRRLDQRFGFDKIVGQSRQMSDVLAKTRRAAAVDSTVLVLGESGTGKELIAEALHQNSPRKKGPFVAVNCAAVPATLVESELFGHVRGAFTGATDRRIGRFEQADGGTLFIDEIGDFALDLQAKLLRVLETMTFTPVGGHEDKKVEVRVIAATSRDIPNMVRDGKFREDLYYRLNVVEINLPPLRERPDDIPLLVDHFLRDIAERRGGNVKRVSPEAMRRIQAFRWPGNVRELRNALESAIVLAEGDALTERDLPDRILNDTPITPGTQAQSQVPTGMTMEELERVAIMQALKQSNGNRTHAANRLGISVRTLQRKLRQYSFQNGGIAGLGGLGGDDGDEEADEPAGATAG